MENKLLKFSHSPHAKAPRTTRSIMIDVCIALLPTAIMGCVYFGWMAVLMLALSVISAVGAEFIYLLIAGKPFKEILKQFDFTSCVTGLLVGMTISTVYPWYSPIFGSVFAIIVVKMLFGGTGRNVVNPAIAGRIFIFMSFQAMVVGDWLLPSIGALGGKSVSTGATVLTSMLETGAIPELSNLDLFLGTGLAGCIGETCKLTLILGGIYLVIRGVIKWLYPLLYIGVTGLVAVALNGFEFTYFLPSILSGGLILGAIFMATDYVTSPNTTLGNIIYFVLLGVITAVLRKATNMEVVSFAILLMNLVVPLIDKFVYLKPFGFIKQAKAKEKTNG